jgi:amidase
MPFDGPAPEGRIKVAFTKKPFEFALDPAVETALDTARDALVDAGYEVVEVDPPLVHEAATEGARCLFGEVKALMEADIRKYGSSTINAIFDEYFKHFVPYEGKELLLGMAKRSHFVRQWLLFLDRYPLVLTPLLLSPTYEWDADTRGAEGVSNVLGAGIYVLSMNFLGLPAGNVPASYNDGLPVGVQVIGRRFREDMILDACEAIEQRVGVMAEKLFARG